MRSDEDRVCTAPCAGQTGEVRARLRVWAAMLFVLVLAVPSQAITWFGADGQWNWLTFWEGWRYPDTGDDVWIVDTAVWGPKTLIYVNPHAGHTPTLRHLFINSFWPVPTTVLQGQDALVVDWEEVGSDGRGQYIQRGGFHAVNEALYLGQQEGAWGRYQLSGGELHVYGTEYVGSGGTGDFQQYFGGHKVDDGLYLAWYPNARGTYRLYGGSLDTDKTVVGYGNEAEFYQYAGSNHTTDYLRIGYLKDAEGTYELQGGDLNTGTITVGYYGKGTFEQTAGIHRVASDTYVGYRSGAFNEYYLIRGRNLIGNDLHIGYDVGAHGNYTNEGGNVVTQNTYLGTRGTGNYLMFESGDHTCQRALYVGHSPGAVGFFLVVDGDLFTDDTFVGYEGQGGLRLTRGATHTVAHNLYLGYAAGSRGSYFIDSSTLRTDNTYVGHDGAGQFTLIGGSHLVDNALYINGDASDQTSDYVLFDGLLSAKDEFIGARRAAEFYHFNTGVHEVRGKLCIGLAGSSLYQLRDGEVSVMDEYLGLMGGDAAFKHYRGTHTVQGSLVVGHSGTARYLLTKWDTSVDAGDLTAQAEIIGYGPGSEGSFLQDDGDHLVRGDLTLGQMRDAELGPARGSYALADGNLTVNGNVIVGQHGVGEFVQQGGTHTADVMYLGLESPGQGKYELSGTGTLDTYADVVAFHGAGTFLQTGGTHTTNLLFVSPLDGTGSYNMSGGQLNVADTLQVGENGSMSVRGGSIQTGKLEVSSGGTFEFLAGMLTTGGIEGNLVNAGGTLCPGNSPGLLSVTSSYTHGADATLLMELGGLTRGDEYDGAAQLHDALVVADTLSLGGALEVVWWGDFTASDGDVFDILDWGTLHGRFEEMRVPGLADGLYWHTGHLYSDGSLRVVSSPYPASVPVPGALLLCGPGLVGIAMMRKRIASMG